MNKEIQYRYNSSDFHQRMRLLLDKMIQQEKNKNGNHILFIVIPALIGIAFLYFSDSAVSIVMGVIFLMIGIIYILSFFTHRSQMEKFRAAFILSTDETIERLNAGSGIIRYHFSDETFSYADDDYETKVKWNLLHSYLQTDDHLFLVKGKDAPMYFTIGAIDIPRSDFDEICAFVQTKLQPHALSTVKLKSPQFNENLIDN